MPRLTRLGAGTALPDAARDYGQQLEHARHGASGGAAAPPS